MFEVSGLGFPALGLGLYPKPQPTKRFWIEGLGFVKASAGMGDRGESFLRLSLPIIGAY